MGLSVTARFQKHVTCVSNSPGLATAIREETMAVTDVISSFLETDNFAEYEQSVYEKHLQEAEQEISDMLNLLLSSNPFLQILKQWSAKTACRFQGYRDIGIRLKSGKKWNVRSPVFLKAKPKGKRGRPPKRQKGALRHLGLELVGIIKQVSPALVEVCVSMAVLCPSFEVAANALRGLGIQMNQHLLQNLTRRFAGLAMNVRCACFSEEAWQKSGIRILICVDGGRFRERITKRGKRKKNQKRQGFKSDWVEPRLLTISQFDENGKKIKSISPIIDGSCGSMDDFFKLLKQHLLLLNIDDASEIVFSADGGNGIWPRVDNLISELKLNNAKCILDYTHAKQNLSIIWELISETEKLSNKEIGKLSKQILELLWSGNIDGITDIVKKKLSTETTSLKTALKKLGNYFGNHSMFQYKMFKQNGLPTGSGTVESAIRRVINLRVKSTGMFWKRKNAEKMIFLRSLVLTGKLKTARYKALGIVKDMFAKNVLDDLCLAA